MRPDISDETLMAFADGTLDEPQFSTVADAVERDEVLAARLELLVNGAVLARSGYAPLLQPVPRQLEASVLAAVARSKRRTLSWPAKWHWNFAIGGLVAAMLVAVVASPVLLSPHSPGPLDIMGRAELTAALDTLPSGENTSLGQGQLFEAIATFTAADGRLCREFEAGSYVAVACRSDAGWNVEMAVATSTTPDEYRPAAGLSAIDAYLDSIGASAPLLDDEEALALDKAGL